MDWGLDLHSKEEREQERQVQKIISDEFSEFQAECHDAELTKSRIGFLRIPRLIFTIENGHHTCARVEIHFSKNKVSEFYLANISYCSTNTSLILQFIKILADRFDILVEVVDASNLNFYQKSKYDPDDPDENFVFQSISLHDMYLLCDGRTYYEKYLGDRHADYKRDPEIFPMFKVGLIKDMELKFKLLELISSSPSPLNRGKAADNHQVTSGEVFRYIRGRLKELSYNEGSFRFAKSPEDKTVIQRYASLIDLASFKFDVSGLLKLSSSSITGTAAPAAPAAAAAAAAALGDGTAALGGTGASLGDGTAALGGTDAGSPRKRSRTSSSAFDLFASGRYGENSSSDEEDGMKSHGGKRHQNIHSTRRRKHMRRRKSKRNVHKDNL